MAVAGLSRLVYSQSSFIIFLFSRLVVVVSLRSYTVFSPSSLVGCFRQGFGSRTTDSCSLGKQASFAAAVCFSLALPLA